MVFWRPRDEREVFLIKVVEILLKKSSEFLELTTAMCLET